MVYKDNIFGKVVISDRLASKIIKHPEFQRLKKIACQGIPERYYFTRVFNRFEHSIGVYLILKKINADYKEQIAGLLHDISHKAFSHVYDWVIKDYTKSGNMEDAQDILHATYLNKSTIKKLIIDHGIEPYDLFDLNKHKLLDSEIPNLCADRIEYSIRSLPPEFATTVLESLIVKENRIVLKDIKVAKEYAYKFLALQNDEWGSNEAAVRYYHFSEILKLALKHKVLSLSDFDLDDMSLIKTIIASKISILTERLSLLKGPIAVSTKSKLEKKVVYKKFRYIDPEILNQKDNKVFRLSSYDLKFKKAVEQSKRRNKIGTEFTPLW